MAGPYHPADAPTLYFIGVTTGQSSIMRVFPAWAEALGLNGAVIKGMDFPLHADPAAYREAVAFIKSDPLSLGALVTTHKLDLFDACRDLFDHIDPLADLMREVSCLSKRGGTLTGHAKDPVTAGLALESILAPDYFGQTAAEVFCMGAGGAATALTWALMQPDRSYGPPARIVVSDRDPHRLADIRRVHEAVGPVVPCTYVLAAGAGENDSQLAVLGPHALVINATGLGKDAPGSPLTDAASFPRNAIVWELNYRGALVFLDQARAQADAKGLTVSDGWTYFVHGWTEVIAEVFGIEFTPTPQTISHLSRLAGEAADRP